MKLSDWARKNGSRSIPAWRWSKAGILLVPARRLPTGAIRVEEPSPEGRTARDACVSSSDQKDDLERQVRRLKAFARKSGWTDDEGVTEIGSGLNGKRKRRLRVLRDPRVGRGIGGPGWASRGSRRPCMQRAKALGWWRRGRSRRTGRGISWSSSPRPAGGGMGAGRRGPVPGGRWRRWDASQTGLSL